MNHLQPIKKDKDRLCSLFLLGLRDSFFYTGFAQRGGFLHPNWRAQFKAGVTGTKLQLHLFTWLLSFLFQKSLWPIQMGWKGYLFKRYWKGRGTKRSFWENKKLLALLPLPDQGNNLICNPTLQKHFSPLENIPHAWKKETSCFDCFYIKSHPAWELGSWKHQPSKDSLLCSWTFFGSPTRSQATEKTSRWVCEMWLCLDFITPGQEPVVSWSQLQMDLTCAVSHFSLSP